MTAREFIRTALIYFAVLAALVAVIYFTDNTEAMTACQAADHSREVCELTLNP